MILKYISYNYMKLCTSVRMNVCKRVNNTHIFGLYLVCLLFVLGNLETFNFVRLLLNYLYLFILFCCNCAGPSLQIHLVIK